MKAVKAIEAINSVIISLKDKSERLVIMKMISKILKAIKKDKSNIIFIDNKVETSFIPLK